MIKFSGKTSRIVRVSRNSDGTDSFVTIIDPSVVFTTQQSGFPYSEVLGLYKIRDIVSAKDVEDKEVSALYYMKLSISKVINKTKIIWEIITSCFGTGIWRDEYKWVNTEQWKN